MGVSNWFRVKVQLKSTSTEKRLFRWKKKINTGKGKKRSSSFRDSGNLFQQILSSDECIQMFLRRIQSNYWTFVFHYICLFLLHFLLHSSEYKLKYKHMHQGYLGMSPTRNCPVLSSLRSQLQGISSDVNLFKKKT